MNTLLSPPRRYQPAVDPTLLLPVGTQPLAPRARFLPAASSDYICTAGVMGLLSHAVAEEVPHDGWTATEGSSFGSYHIVKSLGYGGFGDVWLAEQRVPLHREVALKLIRPGIAKYEAIARFKRERQAMAMMEHENIAKVYDASSIEGTHYFAMEYVPGLPITKHVKTHNLTLRQRIELFVPVCRAVHHAHQKQVLHRDLKPANILVAVRDGVAVPKVIDFGIAKPLSEQHRMMEVDDDDLPVTQAGYCLGTPQYMSPEQAMGLADIDAASDTYALGVVLYEMLVGEPPITRHEMAGLAPHQQLDRVIQHETELPSTLWLSATTAKSTRRYDKTLGDNPRRISRQMRGDLDWIIRKALDKDRSLRYSSAEQLADDLAAYLCDEPISAGPPSLGYRWRKSCHRHRLAAFATSLVLFTLLLCGITFDQWQRAEAACAHESHVRAASEQAKTEALELVNFVLHDLRPKLEAVNQTRLLKSVTDKAAAYYQAQGQDLADTQPPAEPAEILYRGRGLVAAQ